MTISESNWLDTLAPPHRNQLIQAFTRLRYSRLYRIPIAKQRQLQSHWNLTQRAIAQLYPDLNLDSAAILQDLQRRGDAWWQAKGVKGKGVDW